MSRVRHLSSVHDVHDTRVTYKECASLAAAGHDVALLNCHDGDIEVAGVRVIGLGAPRGRIDRILRKTWAIFFRALRERADIYHFHDPELMGVGLALRLCGKKVVYDVHEDVPLQIMNKTWIPGWLKRPLSGIVRVLEGISGRALSAIVAATPSIAAKFPAAKTVVVQNFPEKGLANQRNEKPFGALDAKVRKELRTWLRDIHHNLGVTSILVTHDQEEALEVSDEIVVMNHGKIEQTGSAEAIYRKPENAFVTEFLGETDAFEGRIEKGIWHYNGFAWKLDAHYKWQEQTATGYIRPHEWQLAAEHETPMIRAKIEKTSSLYVTAPVGYDDQPDFVN
ncbi:MAG: glycosyltransferase, partial [Arachnia propionica]